MASIDKLLKYMSSQNVSEFMDEEDQKELARDVVKGYQIDDKSRASWLKANQEAVNIIKHYEDDGQRKDFPFAGAAKVIYPLISPAIIQLSSRMIQHIVRNGTVGGCTVLGTDTVPEVDQNTGQPLQIGQKAAKAKRVTDYMNYKFMVKSDEWLLDEHKLCMITAGWGIGFKMVYYDPILKDTCHDVLPPQDVIINNNTTNLDSCRRITIRHYMTKNDLIKRQRSGEFNAIDNLDCLDTDDLDNTNRKNDTDEPQPVYEVLQQLCYYDLDDDDYDEPYIVWVHNQSETLLCAYPAYALNTIDIDNKGKILSIRPKPFIIDRHLIDDPEGKYYSLGLNGLLLHQNKSLTSVLRQLIDAGTLSNTAGSSGFVTKAFKTKERNMKVQMGVYKEVDIGLGSKIQDNIMSMPFREPSQVLLALLQFLAESGKETGFMTDILTGDNQQQNVPATTQLACIEQATRAFKPVVQKLQISQKKEFKLWFDLMSENTDSIKDFNYQGAQSFVQASDFDSTQLDIMPVADPTMSSEAHKYARLQAIQQFAQQNPTAVNMQEVAMLVFTELEFETPEKYVAQPQPQQPDPTKMAELQLKATIAQQGDVIKHLKLQLEAREKGIKLDQHQQEINIKAFTAKGGMQKSVVDAHNDAVNADTQSRSLGIQAFEADTERQRVKKMPSGGRD